MSMRVFCRPLLLWLLCLLCLLHRLFWLRVLRAARHSVFALRQLLPALGVLGSFLLLGGLLAACLLHGFICDGRLGINSHFREAVRV